ncbi:hypothetical protein PACILC2_03890 [Paenibacillus cisolokensis]|uniref:Uncharacterized protein n=1 Tax=Paenibacillus cisolokensis TaxID=1658519 RepID=A0ABQ4N0W5_9BACL|nr:hypothetical protein PACILC2_03890 [Paenibacillus cisolokensis]
MKEMYAAANEWILAGTLKALNEQKATVVKGGIAVFAMKTGCMRWITVARIWAFRFIWEVCATGC